MKKRRATKACLSCRTRKVRCDYAEEGVACSNCKIDGFDCHTVARKKRRTQSTLESGHANPVQPNSLTQEIEHITDTELLDEAINPHYSPNPTPAERRNDFDSQPQHSPDSNIPAIPRHTMLHQVPHYAFLMGLSRNQESQSQNPIEDIVLQLGADDDQNIVSRHSRLGEHEIRYLQMTGSLSLPNHTVMNELVQVYFRVFHPFFPIIDKPTFLEKFDQLSVGGSPGPSILLLQAVLFIGSGFVRAEVLRTAGYKSRKHARQQLYGKTRRLYDLDFEDDNIATIQALLLMSQYYPSITEKKHTWHWIHQAISLAHVTGLHRHPGDVPYRKTWSRIWWACLIRDRCNGIGTGRPLMINSLDCNVPMLTLDDLQESGDNEEELQVKLMFIEFVKLFQYVEGVLTLRYSNQSSNTAPPELKVCEDALQHWLDSLPPAARRQEQSQPITDQPNIATLYRAVLHSGYNTVKIALYQSHTLWNMCDSSITPQKKVEFAALDSTQLFSQLVNLDLVKYCPTIAVTFVLSPLIVHVLGMRSSSTPELKQLHNNRYDLCMIFLRQLRDIYWHASFYCQFFELAASLDKSGMTTNEMETQDPLASFLTNRVGIGDLMVLQYYREIGNASRNGRRIGSMSHNSPSVASQNGHPAMQPASAEGSNIPGQALGPEMGMEDYTSSLDWNGVSPNTSGIIDLDGWLRTYGNYGSSIPFA